MLRLSTLLLHEAIQMYEKFDGRARFTFAHHVCIKDVQKLFLTLHGIVRFDKKKGLCVNIAL
jgi:hypothetical protein